MSQLESTMSLPSSCFRHLLPAYGVIWRGCGTFRRWAWLAGRMLLGAGFHIALAGSLLPVQAQCEASASGSHIPQWMRALTL